MVVVYRMVEREGFFLSHFFSNSRFVIYYLQVKNSLYTPSSPILQYKNTASNITSYVHFFTLLPHHLL